MNSFTVEQLLSNTTTKDLRLVVGETGINNPIFNASIIDNPDSYQWFTVADANPNIGDSNIIDARKVVETSHSLSKRKYSCSHIIYSFF